MDKKLARLRRAKKTRAKILDKNMPRLSVNKTPRHIYAQIISADGANVLATSSTVQADIKSLVKNSGNSEAAVHVGSAIAQKAQKAGIEMVAFDRSGFKYHGRVKALAEAARENGLKF